MILKANSFSFALYWPSKATYSEQFFDNSIISAEWDIGHNYNVGFCGEHHFGMHEEISSNHWDTNI